MKFINWLFSQQYSIVDLFVIAFGIFLMQQSSFLIGIIFIVIYSFVVAYVQYKLNRLN